MPVSQENKLADRELSGDEIYTLVSHSYSNGRRKRYISKPDVPRKTISSMTTGISIKTCWSSLSIRSLNIEYYSCLGRRIFMFSETHRLVNYRSILEMYLESAYFAHEFERFRDRHIGFCSRNGRQYEFRSDSYAVYSQKIGAQAIDVALSKK